MTKKADTFSVKAAGTCPPSGAHIWKESGVMKGDIGQEVVVGGGLKKFLLNTWFLHLCED
jgi:hypothetical protein